MWPVWVLAAATVFVAGFRVGLNVRASNVIDVGYSGVIGADRIVHGESPYGHFPVEDARPKCGPADSEGEVRDRVQTNGKCETANPLGDTYGQSRTSRTSRATRSSAGATNGTGCARCT